MNGYRPGKNVQLQENEISGLCLKSREIFLSQSILLELEAPLKICGDIDRQYYALLHLFEYDGLPPESNYLFLRDRVDRANSHYRRPASCWPTKSSIRRTFFFSEGTMSVLASIVSLDVMMDVKEVPTLSCGKRSQTVLTAYRQQPSWTRRYSAVMEVSHQMLNPWSRFSEL